MIALVGVLVLLWGRAGARINKGWNMRTLVPLSQMLGGCPWPQCRNGQAVVVEAGGDVGKM